MRRSDLVACDCLTVITFSNNFDPDQARQNAASDRSLQCLQDSDIILKDFRNAPVIYSLSLPHIYFEDVFVITFYQLTKSTMICHSFDLLMRFILT